MNKSILADSVESLIGSIFVDGGYNSAFKFIKKFWSLYLKLQESNEQDPKTKLQEISQKKFKKLPEYKLIKKTGPSHSPFFIVSLKVLKMKLVKGSGDSIREAQKDAAKKILDLISDK
jgi:ribonuclease-3